MTWVSRIEPVSWTGMSELSLFWLIQVSYWDELNELSCLKLVVCVNFREMSQSEWLELVELSQLVQLNWMNWMNQVDFG